ncbi:PIN domain-containing protein [Streptomyces massasporeus]|uniref:PIN domain-containing protein n=1 Tax=Streptomyces massasporeus TaxID=67324 RepID=UPI0034030379
MEIDAEGDRGISSFLDGFEGLWRRPPEHYRNAIQTYTIVIDTNVLLDLYRFTPKARHELLDLLRKVKDRLWVPHQVAKEYFSRRVDALKDQIDLYDSIPRELKSLHDRAITHVNTFARRCSLSEKDKKALTDPLKKALADVTEEIDKHRASLDLTLAKVASDDPVLKALAELLDGRTGGPFSPEEEKKLLEAYAERSAAKIPPGYKDSGKSENPHGDFFVWEQMVRHSSEKTTPVLFITSDVKEDWFQKTAGITVGARSELIAEMRDRAQVDFLTLQLSNFLRESKEALGAKVSEDTYEAAKNASRETATSVPPITFTMDRDLYATLLRHLKDRTNQALTELKIAESQDVGQRGTIDHAVQTGLISQKRITFEHSMGELETVEALPITELGGKFLEISVADKKTARIIENLVREYQRVPKSSASFEDRGAPKGSALWAERLKKSLAPYVGSLTLKAISDHSVTFEADDISQMDTDAIRGLAKSFDIDIHMSGADGLQFTAWARR